MRERQIWGGSGTKGTILGDGEGLSATGAGVKSEVVVEGDWIWDPSLGCRGTQPNPCMRHQRIHHDATGSEVSFPGSGRLGLCGPISGAEAGKGGGSKGFHAPGVSPRRPRCFLTSLIPC